MPRRQAVKVKRIVGRGELYDKTAIDTFVAGHAAGVLQGSVCTLHKEYHNTGIIVENMTAEEFVPSRAWRGADLTD